MAMHARDGRLALYLSPLPPPMDDKSHSNPQAQVRLGSTVINSGPAPYAGAFFPKSHHFVVNGGVFISNVTNQTSLDVDFRRIPLGDVDLRREIRVSSASGVVYKGRVRGSVRRIYSGRINGRKSDMIVALYQGINAEQEWRQDLSRYSGLRHPNFVQIFAVAVSAGIHGIIAHGDLIPYYDFLEHHQSSSLLSIYIVARTETDFWDANQYFEQTFQRSILDTQRTDWIRRPTGQLCIDLTPSDLPGMDVVIAQRRERSRLDTIIRLDFPDSEAAVIHSMDPYQFHERIYRMYHSGPPAFALKAEWNLGAVMYYPRGSQVEGAVEIASMPDADTYVLHWGTEIHGEILEDGWIRHNSCDVYNTTLYFPVALEEPDSWLCQANHIFSHLQITSNYEDYALIYLINCELNISVPTNDPPQGYLFVSNLTNPISFRWPDAYWSLDPSGASSLTRHQATRLGFPSISWSRRVKIRFWNDGIYAAVRKFQEEKGFDPDSQDLVRQMRYPLFRISDFSVVLPTYLPTDELYNEE